MMTDFASMSSDEKSMSGAFMHFSDCDTCLETVVLPATSVSIGLEGSASSANISLTALDRALDRFL